MESLFTPADLDQIHQRGSELEKVRRQLAILREPPPPIHLDRPCLLADGIKKLHEHTAESDKEWSAAAPSLEQFIPASGAATRMFSFLPATRGSGTLDLADLRRQADAGKGNAEMTFRLLESLELLPFFGQLESLAREKSGLGTSDLKQRDPGLLLELMVDPAGLGLLARPKGLLPFHSYADGSRTAFEEHLHAAIGYLTAGASPARFHFTVAADQEKTFRRIAADVSPTIVEALGSELEICFSLQDPATDTIATDPEGRPVRDSSGCLLFRPGGHGSLLANLSKLSRAGSRLVILKNIDNIAPERRHRELSRWKRLLAGHLVGLRRQTFEFLDRLEAESPSSALLSETLDFLGREFAIDQNEITRNATGGDLADRLRNRLDRPLRVCGMVLNSGEPGGGPFWVRRQDGSIDGQIVEGSQVDRSNPEQVSIWASSSHFNPVDIVCSLLNRAGTPYDLERFVDPSTYFVATKEFDGDEIKVLERPGLWNGAMADWNTAFIEVPEQTFAPVKTLFDLLRPAHQG